MSTIATPPHPQPGRPGATRRSLVLVCAVALGSLTAVGAMGGGSASAAPARAAQTVPGEVTTTLAPSAGGATTSAVAGAATTDPVPSTSTSIASENRRVRYAIIGLLVVAFVLLVLTIRYWRVTKPVPAETPAPRRAREEQAPVVADPDRGRAQVGSSGRGSRRSVAGADHHGADADWEPRWTGEVERVELPEPPRARPSSAGRAAVLRGEPRRR